VQKITSLFLNKPICYLRLAKQRAKSLNSIHMKILTGHLTAHDKKAIKAILGAKLTTGKVGKKNYFIEQNNGLYTVTYKVMDRGLIPCPGSQLRLSTYKATFTL
jgi:hypothetical protein